MISVRIYQRPVYSCPPGFFFDLLRGKDRHTLTEMENKFFLMRNPFSWGTRKERSPEHFGGMLDRRLGRIFEKGQRLLGEQLRASYNR